MEKPSFNSTSVQEIEKTSANRQVEQVPAWYRLEQSLMSNTFTRSLLFNWHRVKKKACTIHEKKMAKKYPQSLMNFERKVFSQNGEDGVIEEIFRRIGVTNKFFVEFGVQDGQECCTRYLLENLGWSGVWMDGSAGNVSRGRERFRTLPIEFLERFVTLDNIIPSFQETDVPYEFDLLSIDVDGNDYWFWKKVAESYSPRVVVMEYNATFGPKEHWVKPYDPAYRDYGTAYFGASLTAFAKLAQELGYRLVGCESVGVNAFFVRNDLVGSNFIGVDEPPAFHYVGPHYDSWFGHPVVRIN